MDREIAALLEGRVQEAWGRCLPHWHSRGRVEDFPKGVRKPKHLPDFGNRLGRGFAEKFSTNYPFVVEKLTSEDAIEAACAYDVLEYMFAEHMHRQDRGESETPADLFDIKVALSDQVFREIKSDWIYKEFDGNSVGEFFRFLSKIGEY